MAVISNSNQSHVLTPTTLVSGSAGSAGSSGSSGSAGVMSSAGSCPTGTANVATRSTCTYTANAPQTIMVSTVTTNAAGSAGSASSFGSAGSAGSASSFGSAGSAPTGTSDVSTIANYTNNAMPVATSKGASTGKYKVCQGNDGYYYIVDAKGKRVKDTKAYKTEAAAKKAADKLNKSSKTTVSTNPSATSNPTGSNSVPAGSLDAPKNKEYYNKYTTMNIASIVEDILSKKYPNIGKSIPGFGNIMSACSVQKACQELQNAKSPEQQERAYQNLYDSIIGAIPYLGTAAGASTLLKEMKNLIFDQLGLKEGTWQRKAADWFLSTYIHNFDSLGEILDELTKYLAKLTRELAEIAAIYRNIPSVNVNLNNFRWW